MAIILEGRNKLIFNNSFKTTILFIICISFLLLVLFVYYLYYLYIFYYLYTFFIIFLLFVYLFLQLTLVTVILYFPLRETIHTTRAEVALSGLLFGGTQDMVVSSMVI